MGNDCCTGADAEIPFSVLSTVGDPAIDAYKNDLCNMLANVIIEETAAPVTAPVPTEPPVVGLTPSMVAVTEAQVGDIVIFDVPGIVPDFDAAEILATEGSNDVLSPVIDAGTCEEDQES